MFTQLFLLPQLFVLVKIFNDVNELYFRLVLD